jgi:Icc-related predicted phosphoesterase
MKLIYLTDIHGAFENVSKLLFETVADMYIISGDLIDIPFYNMETAISYFEIQSFFTTLRKSMEQEHMVLEDFVDNLLEMPETQDEIQDKGSKYQQYTIRARRVMQQKYKVLENIMFMKSSARVFTLPGNYDMDMKFTSLHERDLHLRWHQIEGLKIAGYGGADIWTGGIPQKYIINYGAGKNVNDQKNDLYTFFKAIKPDIIAVHQPPLGIHDRLMNKGESGSPALRTYISNNPVKLCLSGHIHSDWGFKFVNECVFLNPSNFGQVLTPTGEISEGGFFYQVEFDDKEPVKISHRKLVGERIYDIAEYHKDEKAWVEEIIDNERFNARKRFINYDIDTEKGTSIREIVLFNDIKHYFRMYQTVETENRLESLENSIKLMKGEFDNIAIDIVGSVNLGMSLESSDIDIVLYLKCGQECYDTRKGCSTLETAKILLTEKLGDKYKFEVIDCIDLVTLEHDIRFRNFESELAQRFIVYRSICRPINYKLISPLEDMINQDQELKKELEGSIRAYFKIFATTSTHIKSFDKYESRLKSLGIKIPGYIKKKISEYLQQENFSNT